MQHVDLKTLKDFLCIPAHDVGYLSPISSVCPHAPNTLSLSETSLNLSCEIKDFGILSVYSWPKFGYLGPVFQIALILDIP